MQNWSTTPECGKEGLQILWNIGMEFSYESYTFIDQVYFEADSKDAGSK